MQDGGVDANNSPTAEPPPPALPKRRNAVLRLLDAPVYRDWIFWLLVGWTLLGGVSVYTSPTTTSTIPKWLDALLAATFFLVLFGVVPAFLRLQIRRWRWRRAPRMVSRRGSSLTEAPAPQQNIIHDAQMREPSSAIVERAPAQDAISDTPLIPLSIDEPIARSRVLKAARESSPYPIARTVRSLQQASDPVDQYQAILDAAEAVSVVLGSLCAAWLSNFRPGCPELQQPQKSFDRGVTLGTWHSIIRTYAQESGRHAEVLTGSMEGLRQGKGGTGLLADLRILLEERNRWAHGARPHGRPETASRVSELFPHLQDVLERSEFLISSPWILVQASAYRRHERDFAIDGLSAMGDHPEFDRIIFSSKLPLANDTFYAQLEDRALDLTPFVVIRYCHLCRQREVCYADRIDAKRGVSLKSFLSGHVVFDTSLLSEIARIGQGPIDQD